MWRAVTGFWERWYLWVLVSSAALVVGLLLAVEWTEEEEELLPVPEWHTPIEELMTWEVVDSGEPRLLTVSPLGDGEVRLRQVVRDDEDDSVVVDLVVEGRPGEEGFEAVALGFVAFGGPEAGTAAEYQDRRRWAWVLTMAAEGIRPRPPAAAVLPGESFSHRELLSFLHGGQVYQVEARIGSTFSQVVELASGEKAILLDRQVELVPSWEGLEGRGQGTGTALIAVESGELLHSDLRVRLVAEDLKHSVELKWRWLPEGAEDLR